jgi:hypothetical protein
MMIILFGNILETTSCKTEELGESMLWGCELDWVQWPDTHRHVETCCEDMNCIRSDGRILTDMWKHAVKIWTVLGPTVGYSPTCENMLRGCELDWVQRQDTHRHVETCCEDVNWIGSNGRILIDMWKHAVRMWTGLGPMAGYSPTCGKLRTVLAVRVCLPGRGSAEVSTSNPVCCRYNSNMASGTTTLPGRGLRLNPNSDNRLASTVARTSGFSLRLLLVVDLGLKEEHAGWRRVASSTGRTISNPRIVAHTPAANTKVWGEHYADFTTLVIFRSCSEAVSNLIPQLLCLSKISIKDNFIFLLLSWNSSDNIVTGYGLDDRSSISNKDRYFSLSHQIQTDSVAQPTP